MYCKFLRHASIASFLRAPSTPSFLMKFGIWVPNMIIFVLVYGLGGGLVQNFSGNGSQSELKLPGRSEKNFLRNFNHSYLAIYMAKLHKIRTTCFHTSLVQDPMVRILKKTIFDCFVVNALELVVLSDFWKKMPKNFKG